MRHGVGVHAYGHCLNNRPRIPKDIHDPSSHDALTATAAKYKCDSCAVGRDQTGV